MTSRHLAITMGDPAGIGPEIIVKACVGLNERIATGDLRLLIIGSGAALNGAKAALGSDVAIPQVTADDRDWPNLCYLQADAEAIRSSPACSAPMAAALHTRRSSRASGSPRPAEPGPSLRRR
jgi:4-hydroxy-L-threonine phosphate dehydrogenase PdxA